MNLFRLWLAVALLATPCLLAQKKPDLKAIAKTFPDASRIAISEDVRYTFKLEKKKKDYIFSVIESSGTKLFTPKPYYDNTTSVFYDDYSSVSNIVCRKAGTTLSYIPVIHTNYEKDDVFHDDIKICAFRLEMAENIVYSIDYKKTYYNPRLFTKVYFQDAYPIKEKSVTFEVPEWVDLGFEAFNFEGFNITKKETPLPAKKAKEIKFSVSDLDASTHEVHSPSPAKYLPHLMVYVKSYNAGGKTVQLFSTHNDIYTWCKTLVDSVDNEESKLAAKAREIVGNETDSVKMMEKVFYWVQDHVRYIAFEDGIMGYKPMPAIKVYNLLYGDCKGMANLTKNLLKTLGYDARLTWIGTSDIPYSNNLPSLAVYNHMICAVNLKGNRYFLDATENYISLNDYAERIQNRPVMIENGKSYINDKIQGFQPERNKLEENITYSFNGTTLKGKSTITLNGEEKTNFLRSIASLKTENRDLALRDYLQNNSDMKVGAYKTTDLNERSKPLTISYDFDLSNAVYTVSNKEMLVLPEKDNVFENLQFDSTRKTDYEFSNRYYLNTNSQMLLPAGYSLKYAPAPLQVKTPDYEITLKYEQQPGKVVLTKTIIIRNRLLKKKQFTDWNKNIAGIKKFYHEPIVLAFANSTTSKK